MVIFLIPNVVKNILKEIEKNGFEAYIVGGFVRDYVLLKKTNDIDIATNALPKDLVSIFGTPKRSIEYGSYHMKEGGYNIDITTYRTEEAYENGRLEKVVYSNSLLEDARRRDFTMNSMYMNKNEEIIDLLNGRKDLKQKTLKMIGNPIVRLKEDPIRILRAVRFAAMYHLKLDKKLKTAILKEKKHLSEIPLAKIRKELDAILLSDGFPLLKKLELLKELGIENKKIVYVEDISGLWAQIKTEKNYIIEKELKKQQKMINNLLKCGTINMLNLYQYGYYICRVAAIIMHFPLKRLEKMMDALPIKSRKDIELTSEEIASLSKLKGRELGSLITEIEQAIVLKEIPNDKEILKKFIEERRLNYAKY